jgi:predicted ATPase
MRIEGWEANASVFAKVGVGRVLKEISVDGFKSFRNFSLVLKPGLNVLVGPNGSGKTNIIRFFEFLYHLSRGSLVEAIGRSGGAGAVFRHEISGSVVPQMSFAFSGSSTAASAYTDAIHQIDYQYSATIELPKGTSSINFVKQAIQMSATRQKLGSKKKWVDLVNEDMRIEWEMGDAGNPISKVREFSSVFASTPIFRIAERDAKKEKKIIEQELIESGRRYPIFVGLRPFIDQMNVVLSDVGGALAYNIDPNAVRLSEDIAGEVGIRPNGAGLAATLYAAERGTTERDHFPRWLGYSYRVRGQLKDTDLSAKMSEYSQLANHNVRGVKVEPDPFENKIRVLLLVDYDDSELRLPLNLASDGTVKWLAIVAAILTNRAIFALEEPENFLHPSLQREIVRIVRDRCESSPEPIFALMTTHSETLINSIEPDEMVVVSMDQGNTTARRPANARTVKEEINKTGFGLAYYYDSGVLE